LFDHQLELGIIDPEKCRCDPLPIFQFVRVDVVTLAFSEAVNEDRAVLGAERHQCIHPGGIV
jgi:hypothetical protein